MRSRQNQPFWFKTYFSFFFLLFYSCLFHLNRVMSYSCVYERECIHTCVYEIFLCRCVVCTLCVCVCVSHVFSFWRSVETCLRRTNTHKQTHSQTQTYTQASKHVSTAKQAHIHKQNERTFTFNASMTVYWIVQIGTLFATPPSHYVYCMQNNFI